MTSVHAFFPHSKSDAASLWSACRGQAYSSLAAVSPLQHVSHPRRQASTSLHAHVFGKGSSSTSCVHRCSSRQLTRAAFQSQTPVEHSQQLQAPEPGLKFQPFTPQNGVRQQLISYRRKVQVAEGTIIVRPLTTEWVHDAGRLLTGAFADAMGYVPMYRTFIQHQIKQYLDRHVNLPPKAIVLVALLMPHIASESDSAGSVASSSSDTELDNEASTSGRDPEQDATLVGTFELSFTQSTRTKYLTLNAPMNCAYLCNMAVDADHRRKGYGNILLDAADDVAQTAGEQQIYLHLRFQDRAPASLYRQAGYVSDKEDCIFVRLLGLDRRYLMKKHLS